MMKMMYSLSTGIPPVPMPRVDPVNAVPDFEKLERLKEIWRSQAAWRSARSHAGRSALGVRTGISFHSPRHRFTVKRPITWYEAGVDVNAMLPRLATRMGHVCYSETAYNHTATPGLLGLAAERCQAADRP
jgi:hypothetical protein